MAPERLYSCLKQIFRTFQISPGEPISVNRLSEQLCVSHTPLREKLACLATEGQIEHLHGRGFFMRRVDDKAIRECFSCIELSLKHSFGHLENHDASYRNDETLRTFHLQVAQLQVANNGLEYAQNIEAILNTMLKGIDNRLLLRAALNAIDQVFFLFPVLFQSKPRAASTERFAMRIGELLTRKKHRRAYGLLRIYFRQVNTHLAQHIDDALLLAQRVRDEIGQTE